MFAVGWYLFLVGIYWVGILGKPKASKDKTTANQSSEMHLGGTEVKTESILHFNQLTHLL